MNGVGSCDRFEREGALKIERGERLGLHYSLCSECKAAYARYQRIIAALSFMDEQEERDAFSEDRLLARLHERSQDKPQNNRRWPKLVPLSAFFGFLSMSRRAAAAQSGKALCAVTALALLAPLPILVGAGEPPEGDVVMVATGMQRPSFGVPELSRATRVPPPEKRNRHASKHVKESAPREAQALDVRKKAEPARPRHGTNAAPSNREDQAAANLTNRRCSQAKCPNVVLEMVVNGLTGYGNRPRGRRANAAM